MFYLIDSNYKVKFGSHNLITGNKDKEQFVLSSEGGEYALATLKEIAKANSISVQARNTKDFKDELCSKLSTTVKIAREVQAVEKAIETVTTIIDEGHDSKTDDQMLLEIVNAGVSFKDAGRLFNKVMTEKGYRISSKNRKEEVKKILKSKRFNPKTWDDVEKVISIVTKEVSGTDEKQALSTIRSLCKEKELELPKKPKTAGAGPSKKLLDFMVEHAGSTIEEFTKLISEAYPKRKEAWIKKQVFVFSVGKAMLEASATNE